MIYIKYIDAKDTNKIKNLRAIFENNSVELINKILFQKY